jgi:DNA-binding NarL/FixJ family response regulator
MAVGEEAPDLALVYVDPVLARSLLDERPRSSSLLTKREKEVLTLLAQGSPTTRSGSG